MAYTPIDLSRQANQFRNERGWFGDKATTFADLPTGRQTLGGVPFDIYEFRTSPVPTVVMLSGNWRAGWTARSVTGHSRRPAKPMPSSSSRPRGSTTGATIRRSARRRPSSWPITSSPMPMARPRRYRSAPRWTWPTTARKSPALLPGAQLAWTRKYPDRDESAVAYIQQWTNARPDVAIQVDWSCLWKRPAPGCPGADCCDGGDSERR